jgi:DUF1365 family protein
MNSCLYTGSVRHRRYWPRAHNFHYPLFMVCLDLAELDTVFAKRWLWSTKGANLAWFRREDHFGDPAQPLDDCVRDLVAEKTGERPAGPIRLLTHLRYFGYVMNPISVYYCFDAAGERVEHVVLEVHNTPWGERHCYVLPEKMDRSGRLHTRFSKDFHVSPFMPLEMRYHCALTAPARSLVLHLENWQDNARRFDATLALDREPITGKTLAWVLLLYPMMTLKLAAAIYFEALRLWWKGTPFYPHPRYRKSTTTREASTHE